MFCWRVPHIPSVSAEQAFHLALLVSLHSALLPDSNVMNGVWRKYLRKYRLGYQLTSIDLYVCIFDG